MKIIVAGDFCPSGRVTSIVENKKYKDILGDVKSIIKNADFSIVNYESPVVLGNYSAIPKCGPNLASTEYGIEAIKWAGFDLVTLANNHIMDYGYEGLKDTICTCKKIGVDFVGGGKNIQEAKRVYYKLIQNKTLAVITCCEHEFSIASDSEPGANPLNPISQYYSIKEAKSKADYVLVIVHGGHEHYQLPSPRMKETYRFFVDAGADAVVNHHQHCYSGYEIYQGKPIFYGLGNFCFDWKGKRNMPWNEGYMVKIDFEDNVSFEIYPYSQCNEKPSVIPLAKDDFDKKIDELNNIISNPESLLCATKTYYNSSAAHIETVFEPYNNRLFNKLYSMHLLPSLLSKGKFLQILNFVNCEAHRDKALFALKKKVK